MKVGNWVAAVVLAGVNLAFSQVSNNKGVPFMSPPVLKGSLLDCPEMVRVWVAELK